MKFDKTVKLVPVSRLTLILMGIWSDLAGGGAFRLEHTSSIKIFGDMYDSLSKLLGYIWSKKGQNLASVRARENPDPISGFRNLLSCFNC